MKTTTKTTRAPRASKQSAAIANRASEQASAATDWRTSPEALSCIAATVAQPAAPVPPATSEVPALPVVTPGATHFRLTRKFIEVASDVRHYEADLAALGYRDGDKIEFGTLTSAGSFTTSAKALREPSTVRSTSSKLSPEVVTVVKADILTGAFSLRSLTEKVIAAHGGEFKVTRRAIRRIGRVMKRKGELSAGANAFIKGTSDKVAAKLAKAAARAAMEYGV